MDAEIIPLFKEGRINPDHRPLQLVQPPPYDPGRCKHKSLIIDEELNIVTCEICKKELNPMYVLLRYSKEETRLQQRIKEYVEMRAELDKRSRCKCTHCGKMTEIRLKR